MAVVRLTSCVWNLIHDNYYLQCLTSWMKSKLTIMWLWELILISHLWILMSMSTYEYLWVLTHSAYEYYYMTLLWIPDRDIESDFSAFTNSIVFAESYLVVKRYRNVHSIQVWPIDLDILCGLGIIFQL